MRDKLEHYIKSHYTDARCWDYVDLGYSAQVRFTRANGLYIASMDKNGTLIEIFKLEGSARV